VKWPRLDHKQEVDALEIGDIVCTILGCLALIILRKISEHSEGALASFQVVGEYYLHGIMDGKSLLSPLPSP